MFTPNRRAAIAGAAASSVALAIPAAQAARADEHPWERVRRLARELSDALEELKNVDFASDKMVAIVEPASEGKHAIFFADFDYYHGRR
jgi:hypothetical protein